MVGTLGDRISAVDLRLYTIVPLGAKTCIRKVEGSQPPLANLISAKIPDNKSLTDRQSVDNRIFPI